MYTHNNISSPDLFFARNDNNQADYLARVESIVASVTENLQQAASEKRDLCNVFDDIVSLLAKERRTIAVNHQTKNAENFGIPSDQEESFSGVCPLTSLYGQYDKYNSALLPKLQSHLSEMKHTLQAFQQTELKIPGETSLNRKTSMEISILPFENFERIIPSHEKYEKLCKICSAPLSHSTNLFECYRELDGNKATMKTLKEKAFNDYKNYKLSMAYVNAKKNFPKELMSDLVLATHRMEINGKMYALSQYFTWMYRTGHADPVVRMSGTADEHSVISILHQDIFLRDVMLKDMANIFKTAIEWDGQDIKTLQNSVALLQYEFAHTMPFKHGSAAIGEWLEIIIYRFHNLKLSYTLNTSVNMEALTLSLKEFVDKYPSLVSVEPPGLCQLVRQANQAVI